MCRVNDVPATTGYGIPVQKLFKLDDGERIVRMIGFDPRVLDVPPAERGRRASREPPYVVAVTRHGHDACASRCGRTASRARAPAAASCASSEGDEVVYVGLHRRGREARVRERAAGAR